MLNILTDNQLLSDTKKLVQNEREMIAEVIAYLDEINERKLFCDLKYHSLFEYCIHELNYSADQAYRRIAAMRLTKRLPEAKVLMENGKLSLSTANLVGALFNDAPTISREEQIKILNSVENLSKNEAEKVIERVRQQKQVAAPKRGTYIKEESVDTVRFSTTLPKETFYKIVKIKNLKKKEFDETLDLMADFAMEKLEEEMRPLRIPVAPSGSEGRYISKEVKYKVYKEANGVCSLCGSTKNLEYDHIHPYALGSDSREENIRLLCKHCNNRQAIKQFGALKVVGNR